MLEVLEVERFFQVVGMCVVFGGLIWVFGSVVVDIWRGKA